MKLIIDQESYRDLLPREIGHIVAAGEQLVVTDVFRRYLKQNRITLHNHYGPSETHAATMLTLDSAVEIPELPNIGKPMQNTVIYLLDKSRRLQPAGIVGELYVGGIQVARGYLNRPQLTSEKFELAHSSLLIADRKRKKTNTNAPGSGPMSYQLSAMSFLYKTGDLARWLPDRNIEFLGRTDHQVKIRGFRVEPGEIETRLLNHPGIKQAVVTPRDEKGGQYLCAYVVPLDGDTVSAPESLAAQLRDFLSRDLPDYMVPSYFIPLDSIPLSPNRKVDRLALPAPETRAGGGYSPPGNETEKQLVRIWAAVLGTPAERIGIDADFFQMGGHSLKAFIMISRIQKELNAAISLTEIFKTPTIRELARFISHAAQTPEDIAADIPLVEEKEYYPLSSAQKRMYILQQMTDNSIVYNMTSLSLLEGHVDRDKLAVVFKGLIRRHESLRTSFQVIEEEPVQRVHDEVEFEIECFGRGEPMCSPLDGNNSGSHGGQPLQPLRDFIRPFDLTRMPLIRVGLARMEDNRHLLMVDMHHIISDGVSLGVFVREFMELYGGKTLAPLKLQYKDYAQWQNLGKHHRSLETQEQYWLKEFAGELPVLNLPVDGVRPTVLGFEGSQLQCNFPGDVLQGLKQYALKEEVTLFMLLASITAIFLSKISRQDTIVTGTPTAGRRHADLEGLIGMFVNTLALKTQPAGHKHYHHFLAEVKEKALDAFTNQDYQYEELVDQLEINRDTGHNPLFDVMFVMQNVEIADVEVTGLTLTPYDHENLISKFDLTISAVEIDDGLSVSFEYNTTLFKQESIQRFIRYFTTLVSSVLENPRAGIWQLGIISEAEKQQVLIDFNNTRQEYPDRHTLHQLVEEQAARTPNQVALTGKHSQGHWTGLTLTYKELNRQADRLAVLLQEEGVRADTIIGLMVERSVEMIIGMLGILKAGGAYLPIDPDYPEERVDFMLKDSGAMTIVSNGLKVKKTKTKPVDVYEFPNQQTNLAYIIYTSGSTGNPKGVLVEHTSAVNLVISQARYFNILPSDRVLQFSSTGFDASVEQIFISLSSGSVLVLIDRETLLDSRLFERFLLARGITHLHAIPSFLNNLPTKLPIGHGIRRIIAGGDICPVPLARRLSRHCTFYNEYGPTETTVTSLLLKVGQLDENQGRVPVGKPIGNTTVYIIDKWRQVVPVGLAGNLFIGGKGVARGYLNRPELTAERFIINPYRQNKYLYHTGDLARWLPGGDIEFLGRIDHQDKIRGFRIELGEIENQLSAVNDVKEAVVIARDDGNGEKYLCAYVIPVQGDMVPASISSDLKTRLSRTLPDYMIPPYFVPLEKFPLNSNGKLDKSKLPDPRLILDKAASGPLDSLERKLVEIWSEILGVEKERIGRDSNFFQLSGHSLKATVLMSRLHKELNVNIPLAQIFNHQTIEQFARYIRNAPVDEHVSIEPAEQKEYYSLSPAQRRLFIVQQMDLESTRYNIPFRFYPGKDADPRELENNFGKMIRRHESLRTSFHMIDGNPVQKIHDTAELEIETVKPGATNIAESFVRPFDLSSAPLMKVGLREMGNGEFQLLVDMHHIISDGVSHQILERDLNSFREGNEPSPLKLQYRDYSQWQNSRRQQQVIKTQESFWLKEFPGEVPVLDLPTDYPRPVLRTFEGNQFIFYIGNEPASALRELSVKTDTTLYMILLSACNILLSKLSGQEDIVIGSPIAGRRHADLKDIIGIFINTLSIRSYPTGEKTVMEFLKEVKKLTLDVYENQDYSFEDLVGKISVKRDTGRNPVFDILFNFLNQLNYDMKPDKEDIEKITHAGKAKANHDITFRGVKVGGAVHFTVVYCTALYKGETIKRFITYFKRILNEMVNNPVQRLSAIDYISREEKDQILFDFNRTDSPFPHEASLHGLFQDRAEQAPDRVAVYGEDASISFRELNNASHQLARQLNEKGVGPGSIVAIMTDRSENTITGIIGILKAGGAYLPIDPDYPQERIDFMLEDSGASVSLGAGNALTEHRSIPPSNPSSLAYLLYTSGTTGKPKGVMIEHRSVVNLVLALKEAVYRYDEPVNVSLVSPFVFDASVKQVFPSLLLGHTLNIVPEEARLDGDKLVSFYKDRNIRIADGTPAHLKILLNDHVKEQLKENLPVEHFVIGGEELTPDLCSSFISTVNKEPLAIINVYGPTECCDVTTLHTVTRDCLRREKLPIGSPIDNMETYVLSPAGKLQPIGAPGELYIGGLGIGRGYLNRPQLTGDKFVHHPFREGKKLYRSGDLVRWLPDATLEFLGRIDHQVKIRGFRIELTEIENQLSAIDKIKEARVTVRNGNDGEKYLCAYIVFVETLESDKAPLIAMGLKERLARKLPHYMIPDHFVPLEKIPLTARGKIDREILPQPESNVSGDYIAPTKRQEDKLAEIWSEVLGIDKNTIGVENNFFDLGGQSLRATLMAAKIHKTFNIKIPITEIFKTPTIRGLAHYILDASTDRHASIEPAEKREYYPPSAAQLRLYIVHQMDPNSIRYNMLYQIQLGKTVDRHRLETALDKLIRRHESFRTTFHMVGQQVVQRIRDKAGIKIEIEYFRPEPGEDNPAAAFSRPFDLSKAPLLRIGLLKTLEEEYMLMTEIHHIISDGTSRDILEREFTALYEGKEPPPLKLQYKDYSQWQNGKDQQQIINAQETFWLKEFSVEPPVLDLPCDYPRPAFSSYKGSQYSLFIDEEVPVALKELCIKADATLYMVLLSAFNILLSKLSGQEDIVIGSPIASRKHTDLQDIIGMFTNTLSLRNYPAGKKTITRFLEEVKERTLKVYENQDYPFEQLVDNVSVKRDTGRHPIFDVLFNFLNQSDETEKIDNSYIGKVFDRETAKANYDITFRAAEMDESLYLNVVYCTALFTDETIQRFIVYFKNILNFITGNPGQQISAIDYIPKEEKDRILIDFNRTNMEFPVEATIHGLFEDQVERTPHRVALYGEGLCLSYKELNRASLLLARGLNERGVEPGGIVGIMVNRSVDTIIGILGILKAGAAYLPIDPDYPKERIHYMMKDSGTHILLNPTAREYQSNSPSDLPTFPLSNPSSLAYIIYTSGSTGKPKGVLTEHTSAVNLILSQARYFNILHWDRVLQFSSIGFDASVEQIFISLSSGSVLVLVDRETLLDGSRFEQFLVTRGITHLHAIPSFLNNLPMKLPTGHEIKRIIAGGDVCPVPLARRLSRYCNFYNEYGPTETTVTSILLKVDRLDENRTRVPVGKPIGNTTVYITDKWRQVVPVGLAGELFIGGKGVARGYLNRPELTAQRFIVNPFGENGYLYRTGDLARWLTGGDIEFLGRVDHQVKIRGFRVEPGEIENRLLRAENVKDAAVMAREDMEGEKYLCAYYVPVQRDYIPVTEDGLYSEYLSAHLSRTLPKYMVPSYFVPLEEFPLNSNGKIDQSKLPDPRLNIDKAISTPQDSLEWKLVEIWSEVLGVDKERIGRDSNFFQLGGHSLKATVLTTRLHKEFNAKVPLIEMFSSQTIAELARYIRDAGIDRYVSIEKAEEKEYYALSASQRRLYIIQQMDLESTRYNIPFHFYPAKDITPRDLENTFGEMILRHESLRTSFHMIDDEPVQKVHD
ncbi:MAG: amino acid adenylation domain-containing protein, partial [bacterium]|nr:amino acid adenylation domain-containing protein [bacterium]